MQETIVIRGGVMVPAASCYPSRAGIKNTIIESHHRSRAPVPVPVNEPTVTSIIRVFDGNSVRGRALDPSLKLPDQTKAQVPCWFDE